MDDAEVAEEAHVTAAWLSAVKNDRIKNPPLDKLRAVAAVLRVPLFYFTEPLGVIPLEDAAGRGTEDWVVRMRGDPELTDQDKTIIEDLAARLRTSKPDA